MASKKCVVDLDLNHNQLKNARLENLSEDPSSPTEGQIYYNTIDKVLKQYNGTSWVAAGGYTLPTATYKALGGVKTSGFIGLDANNKLDPNIHFYYWDGQSSTSNIESIGLFQKIYDDIIAEKNILVLVYYAGGSRTILRYGSHSSTSLILRGVETPPAVSDLSSYSQISINTGAYSTSTISNGIITAVNALTTNNALIYNGKFLGTDVDYVTPYTPLYDGSPATKKYVDDNASSTPIATTSVAGKVKPDGTTISVDASGVITALTGGSGDVVGPSEATNNHIAVFDGTTGKIIKDSGVEPYTLPTATTTTIGGVKVDGSTITITDGVISSSGGSSSPNSWVLFDGTVTFVSVSNPTGVIYLSGDISEYMGKGARIKMTNGGNTIYGIVTLMGAYDSGNDRTQVTFLHQINISAANRKNALYLLANSAITDFKYSNLKIPTGFPANPDSWTLVNSDANDRTQSSPGSTTWYNLGTTANQLTIQPGLWYVDYKAAAYVNKSSSSGTLKVTLSDANNTAGLPDFTEVLYVQVNTGILFTAKGSGILDLTSSMTTYLNSLFNTSCTSINFRGAEHFPTLIRARCAYF